MKKLYSRYISILGLAAAFAACSDDDQTGDSILTPTAPTVNITIDHPEVTLLEKDSTFTFTVTLSTPQIVDVAVHVNITGGDATAGEDFTYTSELKIPANRTTATGQVKILADELPEDAETLTITIGDERTENATITPKTMNFTIQNVSSGDLPLTLTWNTVFYDGAGELLAPTDVANLNFVIVKPDGTKATVNTTGFEQFLLEENMPDGEYLIQTNVVGLIDPGELGTIPPLDLVLEYSQLGVMTPVTLEFPAIYNTNLNCSENVVTIASITKAGSSYEVTRLGEQAIKDASSWAGPYDALEPGYNGDEPYDVVFSTGDEPNILINDNFWDSGVSIEYDFGVCGIVTIHAQTFEAGGDEYTVTGSGTYAGNEIVVDYEVTHDGAVVDSNTHTFTKQ